MFHIQGPSMILREGQPHPKDRYQRHRKHPYAPAHSFLRRQAARRHPSPELPLRERRHHPCGRQPLTRYQVPRSHSTGGGNGRRAARAYIPPPFR